MNRPLLAAAMAVLLAVPAAAQNDGDIITMSATVARPVRTVYAAALHAGLRSGWPYRILLLDQAQYTDLRKAGDGKTQTMARVVFEPKGDSTTFQVSAVTVDNSGERRCATQECSMAEMTATMELVHAISAALDSLGAEPRTRADSLAEAGALGYSRQNAIRVGGGQENGVRNELAYLNALRGPGGERPTYIRLGSCCEFPTPNGLEGKTGVLDAYEVTYPSLPRPVTFYINMYDPPQGNDVPAGFTRAAEPSATP